MANEKKHRYRWDHLNEFQRDGTGKYVYTGKNFVFDGDEKSRRRYLLLSGAGAAVLLLLTVLPECLPPVPLSKSPVTLLPWLACLIAAGTVAWATARLIANRDEMREYRLAKTGKALPVRCAISAVFSALAFACQMGYGFFLGWDGGAGAVARPLFSGGALILSLLLCRLHKKAVWTERH